MDPLYQEYFSLKCGPFNITPDPSFLYLSVSHREALAQLIYGINARKGFVVLTGEVGTGKTTLIHALLNELNGNTQTALIFNVCLNAADLLRYVCEDFGLVDVQNGQRDMHDYVTLLDQFLLSSYRKGENCVLILDEAQNLTAEVLESIRLLSNFETSQEKLLQIVLVGQPELADRLNSPELRQLKQRVILRNQLQPLSFAECNEYVGKRLQIAGGNISIFTPKAIEAIYLYSRGLPRLVNILCDNGMLTSYALGKKEIDGGIIEEVAQELSLYRNSGAAGSNHRSRDVEVQDLPKTEPALPSRQKGFAQTSAEDGRDSFPPGWMDNLVLEFTAAMGPLASFVVQEQITMLGESRNAFPRKRLGELMDLLSREILNQRLRHRFYQRMAEISQDSAS